MQQQVPNLIKATKNLWLSRFPCPSLNKLIIAANSLSLNTTLNVRLATSRNMPGVKKAESKASKATHPVVQYMLVSELKRMQFGDSFITWTVLIIQGTCAYQFVQRPFLINLVECHVVQYNLIFLLSLLQFEFWLLSLLCDELSLLLNIQHLCCRLSLETKPHELYEEHLNQQGDEYRYRYHQLLLSVTISCPSNYLSIHHIL